MVELDAQLTCDARRFRTDGNVQYVTQLLIWYEEAVKESRKGGVYKARYEEWLRDFVAAKRENKVSIETFSPSERTVRNFISAVSRSIRVLIDILRKACPRRSATRWRPRVAPPEMNQAARVPRPGLSA